MEEIHWGSKRDGWYWFLTFKFNQLPEFHSVFYVTLHVTLVSQYLKTYRKIFYLLDLEVPKLSPSWFIFPFLLKSFEKKQSSNMLWPDLTSFFTWYTALTDQLNVIEKYWENFLFWDSVLNDIIFFWIIVFILSGCYRLPPQLHSKLFKFDSMKNYCGDWIE